MYFWISSCFDLSLQLQRLSSHCILQHPQREHTTGRQRGLCPSHFVSPSSIPTSAAPCQPSPRSRFRALKCSTVPGWGAGKHRGLGGAGALPQHRERLEGAHPKSRLHHPHFAVLGSAGFVQASAHPCRSLNTPSVITTSL